MTKFQNIQVQIKLEVVSYNIIFPLNKSKFEKRFFPKTPIIESKQLDNTYLKGLRKYPRIRLAIALELANRDLQDEEKN